MKGLLFSLTLMIAFCATSFSTTAQKDSTLTCFTSDELVRIADDIMAKYHCEKELEKVLISYKEAKLVIQKADELKEREGLKHSRIQFDLQQEINKLETKVRKEQRKKRFNLVLGMGVGIAIGIVVSK